MKDKSGKYYDKCYFCNEIATRYNEILRKGGGGGTIVNVCNTHMLKIIKENKKNRI